MNSETEALQEQDKQLEIKAEIYDWMSCVVSAILICILTFTFFVRIIGVIGSSMVPTLHEKDRIVVSNLFFTPKQGDIVVFRKESFRNEPLVKRVVATGGQTVDIDFDKGVVYVDGKALEEDYTAELTLTPLNFVGPITVPEGQLFVLGDNRNHSNDSRDENISFIDERCVMGKVYFVLLPPSNFGSVYKNA